MKEDFLHYVWQHQYFDKTQLTSTAHEPVQVLRCGMHNTNSGPDFLQAQVRVGAVTWNGSVEIHVKSSDWLRHAHQLDSRYDQVVLHVVWENDRSLFRADGSVIPTLELKGRVDAGLIKGYHFFQEEKASIPCGPLASQVPVMLRFEMLDRVLVERLEQKASWILDLMQKNNQDWEATTYQALCYGFGFKINQDAFVHLGSVLPYATLRKHRQDLWQLEALLFGQAGLLEGHWPDDAYLQKLQQEYQYLWHKYQLPPGLQLSEWNLLRLRPANFPAVRLAQLAALLYDKDGLFASLLAAVDVKQLISFIKKPVSDYWQHHYLPGRVSSFPLKGMGLQSIYNLIVNTMVPLLFAYSHRQGSPDYRDRALAWLEQLPAEQNTILRVYQELDLPVQSAADSQAYLQLFQQYCQNRKCLTCSLGHYLLKSRLST